MLRSPHHPALPSPQALELVLTQLGLLPPTSTLPEAFPAVEQEFKVLWADHGDAVSQQYAGACMWEPRAPGRAEEGMLEGEGWAGVGRVGHMAGATQRGPKGPSEHQQPH